MKGARLCFALSLCFFLGVSVQARGQEGPGDLDAFLEALQSKQAVPLQVQSPRRTSSSYLCQSQCPNGVDYVGCYSSSEETCERGECWVVCDSWHVNCPGYQGIVCGIDDEG